MSYYEYLISNICNIFDKIHSFFHYISPLYAFRVVSSEMKSFRLEEEKHQIHPSKQSHLDN